MEISKFVEIIGADFYSGVPDSQLKSLCDYLMQTFGIDPNHHLIAANEGNCVALAAGYHLATGKVPVVYLQNSGEGNIINPVASLLSTDVYSIPMIFIIGWRGEPNVHDEPQHVYQGKITLKLLEDMNIEYYVIDKTTTEDTLRSVMIDYRSKLSEGKNVSFVIKKGALSYDSKITYTNSHNILREEAIKHIISVSDSDPVISTTGKASRELFEIREFKKQSHKYDFLTVGSMGHASSIALGIALNKTDKRIWCIDGDGAVLMHLGAMAVIGNNAPKNLIHIVVNNECHETVGGMPTVANTIDLVSISKACGYKYSISVSNLDSLDEALQNAKNQNVLSFIEIKCSTGSRGNLGRPTTSALENKNSFMSFLKSGSSE